MKKYIGFFVISSFLLFLSFSGNPPQGNSGAPFDRTCARSGCHSGGGGIDGSISILGIPDQVMPGESYDFTIVLESTAGSPARAGVQMVAVGDDEADAGMISNPGADAALSSLQGRTYFEHQPAKRFNGNATVEYSGTWTAPQGGTATFYTSAIFANGSGAAGDAYRRDAKTYQVMSVQSVLTAEVVDLSDVTCNGGSDGAASISVSGGIGTYTYMWSSGETTSMATMLSAGANTVTIQSGDQIIELPFKIDEPEAIQLQIVTEQSVECANDQEGALSVDVTGGVMPLSIEWSNGSSDNTITGLDPGQYSVTVTDGDGCEASENITLFSIDEVVPVIELSSGVSYNLGANGIFSLDNLDGILISAVDNCNDDLEITWSPMEFDCDDVGNNDLTVIVTDRSGNRTSSATTVTIVDTEVPEIDCINERLDIATCTSFSYTQPQVSDNCSSTRLELISGIGINGDFPIGETVEVYQVQDASGNTARCQIIINNDPQLSANIEITDVSCFGDNDGSVLIEAMGINEPFGVEIENGVNSNLSPGEYQYTITDFTGCSLSSFFTVSEPELLLIEVIEPTKPTTTNSGDGAISVEVAGGTPPYEYQWNVDGELFSNEEDLTLLFPNVYSLSVTDSRGCTVASEEIVLEEVTDINDPAVNKAIATFPNPADQFLSISINDLKYEKGDISLFSSDGRLVSFSSFVDDEMTLNVYQTPNGIYILKVRVDNELVVRRVLIQH